MPAPFSVARGVLGLEAVELVGVLGLGFGFAGAAARYEQSSDLRSQARHIGVRWSH